MKTKKPTLAQLQEIIVCSLKKNEIPKDKDALKLLMLVENWEKERPNSHERRKIFKVIFDTFKRRCSDANITKRHTEMWATIRAIIGALKEYTQPSPSFNSFKIKPFDGLTWINH